VPLDLAEERLQEVPPVFEPHPEVARVLEEGEGREVPLARGNRRSSS
jgi:hypothetical protein